MTTLTTEQLEQHLKAMVNHYQRASQVPGAVEAYALPTEILEASRRPGLGLQTNADPVGDWKTRMKTDAIHFCDFVQAQIARAVNQYKQNQANESDFDKAMDEAANQGKALANQHIGQWADESRRLSNQFPQSQYQILITSIRVNQFYMTQILQGAIAFMVNVVLNPTGWIADDGTEKLAQFVSGWVGVIKNFFELL